MRRWGTWLLAGALTALGALAAADALRGNGAEVPAEPRPRATSQPAVLHWRDSSVRRLPIEALGLAWR